MWNIRNHNSDQNIRNHNSDQIMKMEMVIIMSIMTGYHCRFAFPPEAVWGIIETYNNEKINDTTYKSEVIETVTTVQPSERGIEMVPIATEPEDVDADYFLYYLIFVFVILGIHLLFSVVFGLLCGFIVLVIKLIRGRIDKKLEDPEDGRSPLSALPGPVLWAPLPAPLHEMTSL